MQYDSIFVDNFLQNGEMEAIGANPRCRLIASVLPNDRVRHFRDDRCRIQHLKQNVVELGFDIFQCSHSGVLLPIRGVLVRALADQTSNRKGLYSHLDLGGEV